MERLLIEWDCKLYLKDSLTNERLVPGMNCDRRNATTNLFYFSRVKRLFNFKELNELNKFDGDRERRTDEERRRAKGSRARKGKG